MADMPRELLHQQSTNFDEEREKPKGEKRRKKGKTKRLRGS